MKCALVASAAALLTLVGCGDRVAPTTRPVVFRVFAQDCVLVLVPYAAVRAESSSGEVIEQRANGELTLSLDVSASQWRVADERGVLV